MVDEVIHLGHKLSKKMYDFDAQAMKCIADFNRQCNIFLANFKYANSYIKNALFNRYCSSFYGSQLCPLFDSCMDKICRQWRVAIRRVWKIPWQTHSRLLPHIAGVMAPELWFARRALSYLKNALNSRNTLVAYIAGMSQFGSYSVMGGNIRLLQAQYGLECSQVDRSWKESCHNNEEDVRIGEQIRELVQGRDKCMIGTGILTKEESNSIINFLCLD